MSQQLIARNPDLAKLQSEGYALDLDVEGFLLVRDLPYVTPTKQVGRGTIVARLETRGTLEDIVGFTDHTVHFIGEHPCDYEGRLLTSVVIASCREQLGSRIIADHRFSHKPGPAGYASMYAQIKQYALILESHARRLYPEMVAQSEPGAAASPADEGPFAYTDTASVRAGIVHVTAKLRGTRIAIVGLGGTGSYVLDLVAKTPVAQIHLFDDDSFLTHNAFRAPGATSALELREARSKVEHWRDRYSVLHTGVVAHPERVTTENASRLLDFDFVFICIDSSSEKLGIVRCLQDVGTPFIDCGIGVAEVDGRLRGIVRTTTGTRVKSDHILRRISFATPDENNQYERNIQVAELNALNAALAVIKWKKLMGVYHDFEHEHDSTYTINSHLLTRDECHDTSQSG